MTVAQFEALGAKPKIEAVKTFEPFELTLPMPPSVNGYWRSFNGRQIISEDGRKYRAAVVAQVLPMCLPKLLGKLKVELILCEPNNMRRDLDNWMKAPLDALTHAQLWGDDHQIDDLSIKRGPKTSCLKIKISPMDMAMNKQPSLL